VGFNMSWILVDGIEQHALHEALDLAPTDKTPHWSDLGTSRVPLAGATVESGWCAVFARYAFVMDLTTGTNPPRLVRLPEQSRSFICVMLEHAMVSYASLWHGGRYAWQIWHNRAQGLGISKLLGICPPSSQVFVTLRCTSSEPGRNVAGRANWELTMCSTCRSTRQRRSPASGMGVRWKLTSSGSGWNRTSSGICEP
jgi:hypothetical protein